MLSKSEPPFQKILSICWVGTFQKLNPFHVHLLYDFMYIFTFMYTVLFLCCVALYFLWSNAPFKSDSWNFFRQPYLLQKALRYLSMTFDVLPTLKFSENAKKHFSRGFIVWCLSHGFSMVLKCNCSLFNICHLFSLYIFIDCVGKDSFRVAANDSILLHRYKI